MNIQQSHPIRRGDIYFADLTPVIGSEQGGTRPILIIQNNIGNHHSPTVIAAAITGHIKDKHPTHVHLRGGGCGLFRDSSILPEQLRTLDKSRLGEHMGHISKVKMKEVNAALSISIGLSQPTTEL